MNKKKIIVIVAITLLLSTLTIINIPKERPDNIKQEVSKCLEQENNSYIVENGNVECNITTKQEETTESTTATKKSLKTTKKATTKEVKMNIKVDTNEITTYLYQKVKEEGWLTSDYNAIVNIAVKESNLNPNSVNKSSGACGIFQAYPCSKAIKQYPDYMTNYKSQVKWGLNYIKGRYKTPSNAWKFWQEHHWY